MSWFIGVDVGGTFTDFYAVDRETAQVVVHKTPSTPHNPAEAILEGLDALSTANGIKADAITRLAHGTTVATNALIQRKGAPLALITTEGFRDLLEIGRQIRPKMYDLKADAPPPLVPRKHRFEVRERMMADGTPRIALEESAIDAAIDQVAASGAEAVAVCLLFAFLNPEHEQRIGRRLAERLPHVAVSLSSAVQPEFREFERFSTAALNAYLQPLIGRYMRHLGRELEERAPNARLGINQSSGGLMSVDRAADFPVRTTLSGPAAGAVGAAHVARLAGKPNVVTLDMGGTSADVALIRDFEAEIGFGRDVAGFPVRLPIVDVDTVGAGGGSIAWFDRDGLLKVGPASAGAVPGPACYGRGGTEPTVSDANLLLGRLSGTLIGGAMALDRSRAEKAIRPVAERLGFTLERTAEGILGIVTANMVRALRTVSVERGHDPRDFVLMPFGGAGALHAGDVARALDMSEIIIPPAPGILCAQGLVVSDLKEDFVATARLSLTDANRAAIDAAVAPLAASARAWFETEGIAPARRRLRLSIDLRYIGQNFELLVPTDETDGSDPALPEIGELKRRFFEAHEKTYGHYTADDPIETVNLRLTAIGEADRIPPPAAEGDNNRHPKPTTHRAVWFEGAEHHTPVYDRAALAPGHRFVGPAIVDQLDATTVVHPGDTVSVDAALNLIIEVSK
ncbi:MAG: hydantoinase/oxoprolinase family protein [Alphaproteobacteria bacterium]|nr:hydantoinase/oxoprolinase family protein [Alphaproteobacteria bacterium]